MSIKRASFAALTGLLFSSAAQAGGPLGLNFNDPDNFLRWADGGTGIPFNPDQGPLGPQSNEEAVAVLEAAFGTWEAVPTATATYTNAGPLPVDVDETNYFLYLQNMLTGSNVADGLSPIVFDATGVIFEELFGPDSGVLGFAGMETFDAQGFPIEGAALLNGGAISGGFPVETFVAVQVHEYGHYSGLAHTVVNGQSIIFGDPTGPSADDDFGPSPLDQVATMYPFAIVGGGMETLHADDEQMLSTLYPAPGFFEGSASIMGAVVANNGDLLTGVNVIARNVADPFADAVSSISGDRGFGGIYTLNGLTPGAEYALYVDQILAGGFSTPPTALPGPEEWYSGAAEDYFEPVDVQATVSAGAGDTAYADILFGGYRPGDSLPVGDDGSIEVFLPFEFELCGTAYSSVWINANGFLTFGEAAPQPTWADSAEGMISGPPRVAPLWRDVNPSFAGTVTYAQTGNSFTVTWAGVPTWPDFGPNTFDVTLRRASNHIDATYTEIAEDGFATGGVAGVSCGAEVTAGNEPGIDLTAAGNRRLGLNLEPALYEAFDYAFNGESYTSTVDLEGTSVAFNGTTDYDDQWAEPNDSLGHARHVELPFVSDRVNQITEIEPAGSDVDYYRFQAEAGQIIAAEITRSRIDSLMCLFAPDGTLIALDDDGGNGLLSKITAPAATDGEYTLAVGTWPDYGCVGAGNDDPYYGDGRYLLELGFKGAPESGDLLASTGNIGLALVQVDPTTGQQEVLAPAGDWGPVTEIDFRDDGVLFGTTGGGASAVITIDTLTGLESLVGFHDFGTINGLEFIDDTLYGAYWVPGGSTELVAIDQADGSLTPIGATGLDLPITGLAYAPSFGLLLGVVDYAVEEEPVSLLIIVDPDTGEVEALGWVGIPYTRSLAFGPDGLLYLGTAFGDLVAIDLSTGEGWYVGYGAYPLSGLSFVP